MSHLLAKISDSFFNLGRGWVIVFLLTLVLVINLIIIPRGVAALKTPTKSTKALDLFFFYTPEQAFQMLDSYGKNGREAYRTFALSIDVFYPLIYTLAFCLVISWLFKRQNILNGKWLRLNLIPLGAGLFDLLENVSIVGLITVYPTRPYLLSWLAAAFTMLKWSFVIFSSLLVLLGFGLFLKQQNR